MITDFCQVAKWNLAEIWAAFRVFIAFHTQVRSCSSWGAVEQEKLVCDRLGKPRWAYGVGEEAGSQLAAGKQDAPGCVFLFFSFLFLFASVKHWYEDLGKRDLGMDEGDVLKGFLNLLKTLVILVNLFFIYLFVSPSLLCGLITPYVTFLCNHVFFVCACQQKQKSIIKRQFLKSFFFAAWVQY